MSTPSLIRRFADYALALRYEDLPADVVQMAKRILFDTIGTGLGGYQYELGQKAVRFAVGSMPGAESTLLGDGRTVSAEGAAFANATMVKILGMDDSHRSASHIAAQLIPAALAMVEGNRTTGRDFIMALVAAYELAVRVGLTVRWEQRRRGLDVKGTVGTLASALVAGRLAALDERELSHAIALAADMACGTEQYVYDRGECDTKDLISGFAARNGVFATRLAANGFYGPSGGLDGEYGFFRAFGDGYKPEEFEFSGPFSIMSTGFKPHGGCRHTHQAIDAVQDIQKQVYLNPSDIERILVRTYKYALQPHFRVDPEPGNRKTAGLSIRVSTAIAIVRGSAWPEDFAYWDNPEVARLRRLVDLEVDEEIESVYPARNGCHVFVTMKDGQTHHGYTPYAKGEPELPMSDAEIKAKFVALNRAILPMERLNAIYDYCMDLEHQGDLAELLSMTRVVNSEAPQPVMAY